MLGAFAPQICWIFRARRFNTKTRQDHADNQYISISVFEYWNAWHDGKISRREFRKLIKRLRGSFHDAIRRGIASGIDDVPGVCENLRRHEDALWTFMDHEGVPPSNNHAERELRSVVTWRKVCFGSQSERGERFAERLMSVARTARKLGVDMLAYIRDALNAYLEGASCPKLLSYSAQV